MKKMSVFMLAIIVTILIPFQVFAATLQEEQVDDTSYDAAAIDWEEIDKVIVLHFSGYDPFISDAINKGIEVEYTSTFANTPTQTYTYFTSISWIVRDGEVSLSLMPKNPYTVNKTASWEEATTFFINDPIYLEIDNDSKYESMYNQYICHADFAKGLKTPWNIEPWRIDKGYWGFVSSGCN